MSPRSHDYYAGARVLSIGEKLARVNWSVIAVLCAIAGVGFVQLYSIAGGTLDPWGDRQIVRFLFGLGLVLAIAVIPRDFWLGIAYPAYLFALLCLGLVLVIGSEAGGARRWIALAGVTFQPSEMMKVALVLALARYYQWLPERWVSHPVGLLAPLLMIAVPVALMLLQPDLGTAVLLSIVGVGLMFLAGVNVLYFMAAALGAIGSAPVAFTLLHDYQRRRIEVFLNPERDPLGAGYHIAQSKIALGSGGVSGKGFMEGTQVKLDFLPEKHTDFIFTGFGEEWGFVGAVFLLGLFAVLLMLLTLMALRCSSQFARLTISGAAILIFSYVFINIAMVSGLLPVVGVPLPLVSYGGSAMLTVLSAIGLAMCAYVHRGQWFVRGRLGPFW